MNNKKRINAVKMNTLSKIICRIYAIHIKISMSFFKEIKNSFLKFIWKHKRPIITKSILSKKSSVGGIKMPDFKLYYRAIVMKTE
jgi:hypothetical protein